MQETLKGNQAVESSTGGIWLRLFREKVGDSSENYKD